MPLKIVCVDSDPLFGILVKKTFEKINSSLRVHCFTSFDQAFQFLDTLDYMEQPDALLLEMKVDSDLCKEFLQHYLENEGIDIATYLLTSWKIPTNLMEIDDSMYTRVITKPITLEKCKKILVEFGMKV